MTMFLPQYKSPAPIEWNFVTDFGSDFIAWNAYLSSITDLNRDIILHVPSGTYTDPVASNDANFAWDCSPTGRNHTLHIKGPPDRSAIIQLAFQNNICAPSGFASISASGGALLPRIQEAPAGQDWIQLITPSQYNRFTVGDYFVVCGIDMQTFGYPQNQHFMEYHRATAIDSVTGIISLDRPLENTYKTHWPNYGGTFPDHAGPGATIPLYHSWQTNCIVENLTLDFPQQNYVNGHSMILRNCNFDGIEAPLPSFAQHVIYENCNWLIGTGGVEIDKFLGTVQFVGCDGCGIVNQSDSHREIILDGCTGTSNINGAGKRLTIRNSTITECVPLVCIGYGKNEGVTITDCVLANGFNDSMVTQTATLVGAGNPTYVHPSFVWSKNDASLDNVMRTLVPSDSYYQLIANYPYSFCGPVFKITDIVESGGNVYHVTDLPAEPPQLAFATGIIHSPAPFTISGCTPLNMVAATDPNHAQPIGYLQLPGAAGRPLYTYYESGLLDTFHIFNSVNGENTVALPLGGAGRMIGYLVSIEVNVTKAYTGIHSGLVLSLISGGFINMFTDDTFTAILSYSPSFDPHVVGTRLIVPGLTTGTSGYDSGLDIDGNAHWVTGSGITPDTRGGALWNEDPSVWPEFTVKIITDLYSPP